MAEHPKTDDVIRGAILIVISVFMISSMNALAKFLSAAHHTVEITFYRNAIVLCGLCAYLHLSRQWHILKTDNLAGHIIRASVGTAGIVLAFSALSRLPLAEATTLLYTGPLFVTLLSYPFLGEKVGPFRLAAVFAGFTGVVLIAAPEGQALNMAGIGIALCAALFNGLTQLQLRKLGRSENFLTTVFYFMLFGTLITGTALPFVFTGPPAFDEYPFLLLLGAAGALQQILKTMGYAIAPTAVVTPINYTGLLWAVFFGYVFWDTLPSFYGYLGAGIIIGANLFILWRERQRKKI